MKVVPAYTAVPLYSGTLQVRFHAIWRGPLCVKHVLSRLRSCRKWHPQCPITLWLDDRGTHTPPAVRAALAAADIDVQPLTSLAPLQADTPWAAETLGPTAAATEFSDIARLLLLYKYGGIYFDLDVLFLKPIFPVLRMFADSVCAYAWERQPYPNNAVLMAYAPRHPVLAALIAKLHGLRCWGFQAAGLRYSDPLELTVLPCEWFDPDWLKDTGCRDFFRPSHGAAMTLPASTFAYHWHNKWEEAIADTSPCAQVCSRMGIWDASFRNKK